MSAPNDQPLNDLAPYKVKNTPTYVLAVSPSPRSKSARIRFSGNCNI